MESLKLFALLCVVTKVKSDGWAPYPPAGPPAAVYGSPLKIKEVISVLPVTELPRFVPPEIPHFEIPAKVYGPPPIKVKEVINIPSAPELPPLVAPVIPHVTKVLSVPNLPVLAPYPTPVELYGSSLRIKEVVNVPPAPELPPLIAPVIPHVTKVLSVPNPPVLAPYPAPAEVPVDVYGPPANVKKVVEVLPAPELPPFIGISEPAEIYGPPIKVKEVISVPAPPELPPLVVPEIAPAVFVNKPAEVVSVQKPVEFFPYPAPAEIYGPPVAVKKVIKVEKPPTSLPLAHTFLFNPDCGLFKLVAKEKIKLIPSVHTVKVVPPPEVYGLLPKAHFGK